MQTKFCTQCKQTKEYSFFNRQKTSPTGRRGECRECRKKYYKKPKEVVEAWNTKRKERMRQMGLASKGSVRNEEQRATCRESQKKRYENYDYEPASINRVYYRYKRCGLNFDKEHFTMLIKSDCHYCGISPVVRDCPTYEKQFSKSKFCFNGIDRVDNQIGYEKSNCVACCPTCNKAKHAMKVVDFLNWIKKVYELNFVKRSSNFNISC